MYPVVWLLSAAGVGLIDVETASLVIVYLDVVTKIGFGTVALHAWVTMETATAADEAVVTAD